MSGILWSLLSFVVAISLLVTIHEFGHYYIARRCGVRVLRFSIGFGKALWSRTDRHGTEFVIAPIPLGGYVRMQDSRVDAVTAAELPHCFDQQPVASRIAILAAGPLANLLFAVLALWLVFAVGIPAIRPVLGEPLAHSIAAKAGLQPGMVITAVGDTPVRDWEEVNLQLAAHLGEPQLLLTVEWQGLSQQLLADTRNWQLAGDSADLLASLGLQPYTPEPEPRVSRVEEGGAAALAGVQVGDLLLALDAEPYQDWQSWVKKIQASPAKPLQLTLERNGQQLQLTVIAASREVDGQRQGYLGLSPTPTPWPESMRITLDYSPGQALLKAFERSWQICQLIVRFVGKLLSGDVALDHLSGPIAIAQGAGASAGIGWIYFLSFLALISINLGVINLIPLPVLDGGHLLFLLIEAIRGKPLPERVQELGFRLGWGILLALMGVALFNDFSRL